MNTLSSIIGMLSVLALALGALTDLFGRKVKLNKNIAQLAPSSPWEEPTVELTEAITNWQLMNKGADK